MLWAIAASIILSVAWARLAEKIVIIASIWFLIDVLLVAIVLMIHMPWSKRLRNDGDKEAKAI